MAFKRLSILVSLILLLIQISAQEFSFTPDISIPCDSQIFGLGTGLELNLSSELTSREFLDFHYNSPYFSFIAAASFNQNDKYSPDIATLPGGTLFNSYFTMDQGGILFRGLGLEAQIGRLEHRDVIDSPYSLFISSKRMPTVLANFRYENGFAFYESRWLELNSRSIVKTPAFPGGFPDRGSSLKTYGVKLGTMRFGFQDAAVYTGRSFDLEYLVSPMPNYLIQYTKGTLGRPWSTGSNENDIMGGFWDWKPTDRLYVNAQILVDDIHVFGLFGTPLNPWKTAYSVGARWDSGYGVFGFYHALATKYTFGTTTDANPENAYPWAYYPDTRFAMDDGFNGITIEDSMIGYYNGENNMAFRLDYKAEWFGFSIDSNLEFVLSGAKSPANAWHEYLWYPTTEGSGEGSRFLDYKVLEKKLVLDAQISRRVGDFILFSNLKAGVAFNALQLEGPNLPGTEPSGDTVINQNAWIWRPGDKTVYKFSISLGMRYSIPVMSGLTKK